MCDLLHIRTTSYRETSITEVHNHVGVVIPFYRSISTFHSNEQRHSVVMHHKATLYARILFMLITVLYVS